MHPVADPSRSTEIPYSTIIVQTGWGRYRTVGTCLVLEDSLGLLVRILGVRRPLPVPAQTVGL